MNRYLNTVIVTAAACQIAQMLTHDTESYKRIVHIICALVILLTIAEPVAWLAENMDTMAETISGWTVTESETDTADDPYEVTAQAIMEHAAQRYGWDSGGMKITLVTDGENGELREIQLYPVRCAYAERLKAEGELSEIYGVPVYIYNQRE